MLTAALGIVTLAFSFSFSPPEAFVFADKFEHGIMYFATFFSFLRASVWRAPGGATARSRAGSSGSPPP